MGICEEAQALSAVPVTTRKDLVRLPEAARPMVKVLSVDLRWQDEEALASILGSVVTDA